MSSLIRSKRGQAMAGTMQPPTDYIGMLQTAVSDLTTTVKNFSFKETAKTAGRNVANLALVAAFSTDLAHGFSGILRAVLKPIEIVFKWFFARVLFTTQVLIVIILVTAMWYGFLFGRPIAEAYAQANDINSFQDFGDYVWKDLLGVTRLKSSLDRLQNQWKYQTLGQFTGAEAGADKTLYGIYFNADSVVPDSREIQKGTPITVYANPQAQVLTSVEDMGCVEITCTLEDGVFQSKMPAGCVPLDEMPGTSIECRFEPFKTYTYKALHEATVSIRYPFIATSTLPIAVMDSEEYRKLYQKLLPEYENNIVTTKTQLAKGLNVDPSQKAESKITPVVIGAEIIGYQPLRKSSQYPSTLQVSIINIGEGTANITGIEIDTGSPGLKLEGSSVPLTNVGSVYAVDSTYIKQLKTLENFISFRLTVNAADFPLQATPQSSLTKTRMSIKVNYEYSLQGKTNVKIATCANFPAEPECTGSSQGTPGTTVPANGIAGASGAAGSSGSATAADGSAPPADGTTQTWNDAGAGAAGAQAASSKCIDEEKSLTEAQVETAIRSAANKYGVPARYAVAVALQENGLKHCDEAGNVIGSATGDYGLMQINKDQHPSAFPSAYRWQANIEQGVSILSDYYKSCSEDNILPCEICKGRTYSKLNCMLRKYNGWSCCPSQEDPCDCGHYVAKVTQQLLQVS